MMLTQRINVLSHDLSTKCHVSPVQVDTIRATAPACTLIRRELLQRRASMEESNSTHGE